MENKSSSRKFSKEKRAAGDHRLALCCKKHPNHRQSAGVCSICLREKLSKLASTSSCSSRAAAITSASSASSSLSSLSSLSSQCSSNASSCSSPIHRRRRNNGSHGKGFSLPFLKSGKKSDHDNHNLQKKNKIAFTKSRSMAFVEEGMIIEKKKKGGFWSKLLTGSTTSKKEGLMHSRTMKDTVITTL